MKHPLHCVSFRPATLPLISRLAIYAQYSQIPQCSMIQLTKCLFHLLFFGHVFDTVCMFHKRQRPDCTGTPAQKLQRCIVDKFLTNGLTGKEAQTWVNHGSDAGLGPFDKYRGTPGKNSKRNMLKKCMRGRGWPKLYRANVTVFDKKNRGLSGNL